MLHLIRGHRPLIIKLAAGLMLGAPPLTKGPYWARGAAPKLAAGLTLGAQHLTKRGVSPEVKHLPAGNTKGSPLWG